MIKINLLPYKEKQKKETMVRQVAIMVLSLVVFLCVVGAVHLFFTHAISGLESDIAAKEKRLAELKKIIGEIDTIKVEKATFEKKLSVITRLDEDRLYPIKLLDEINQMTPAKDLWLNKVSETGTTLNIEGVGRDNLAVALYMKILETSKHLQSVDLVSTKQVDVSGLKLQQFTLSCVKKRS